MIISRTPFRVSFLGGGTDLPDFYLEEEGAVLSTAIDKYIYITINDRFDGSYRLSYSKTEIHEKIDEIEHKIFRNVLTTYGPIAREHSGGRGLELLSMADIPSGTGLGSSSSFTVGLLHAVKAHIGRFQSYVLDDGRRSTIRLVPLHRDSRVARLSIISLINVPMFNERPHDSTLIFRLTLPFESESNKDANSGLNANSFHPRRMQNSAETTNDADG